MEKNIHEFLYHNEQQHWWFVGRRKYIHRMMLEYLSDNFKNEICEVGCGSGANLKMLSTFGAVDAIEMDERALQRARILASKCTRRFEHGYLPADMPLSGPYDAIVVLDVIEHIDDDITSLVVLGNALKSDGRLVLTVPAYHWMWSHHDDANHHKRRYSSSLLKHRLNEAGYSVLYISYFNTLLFPVAFIVRMIQKITPFIGRVADEYKMPSIYLNKLLSWIFGLESLLSGRVQIPFGLSLAVVAVKS